MKRSLPSNVIRHSLFHAAVMLSVVVPAIAQTGGSGGELQQKLAAVKQSVAENQQKLHQYQWAETTQLTLKGDAKPPKTSTCQYGPDGKVQKTPTSAPSSPPPSGGKMKQKIIEKKKEEMQDYLSWDGDVERGPATLGSGARNNAQFFH